MHFPYVTDLEQGEVLDTTTILNKLFAYRADYLSHLADVGELPEGEDKLKAETALAEFLKEPFKLELSIVSSGTVSAEALFPVLRFDEHAFVYYSEKDVPDVEPSAFRRASLAYLDELLTDINTHSPDSSFRYNSFLPKQAQSKIMERAMKIYESRGMPVSKAFGLIVGRVIKDRKAWDIEISTGVAFDTYLVTLRSNYFTLHVNLRERWDRNGVHVLVEDFKFELPNYHVHSTVIYPTKNEFNGLMAIVSGMFLYRRSESPTILSDRMFREIITNQNIDYFANALTALDRRELLKEAQEKAAKEGSDLAEVI